MLTILAILSAPGLTIEGGYTYWISGQDQIAYCYNVDKGKTYYPETKPSNGFRIAAEVDMPYDKWGILLEYYWFSNNNEVDTLEISATKNDPSTWSTWSINEDIDNIAINDDGSPKAASAWSNTFQRGMATIGRGFLVGDNLLVRAFLGLVGAYEDQVLDITYIRHESYNTNTLSYLWSIGQNFWGIGPYVGMSPSYLLANSDYTRLSVHFNINIPLMWKSTAATMLQSSLDARDIEGDAKIFKEIYMGISPLIMGSVGVISLTPPIKISIQWEEVIYLDHFRGFSTNRYYRAKNSYYMHGLTGSIGIVI